MVTFSKGLNKITTKEVNGITVHRTVDTMVLHSLDSGTLEPLKVKDKCLNISLVTIKAKELHSLDNVDVKDVECLIIRGVTIKAKELKSLDNGKVKDVQCLHIRLVTIKAREHRCHHTMETTIKQQQAVMVKGHLQ